MRGCFPWIVMMMLLCGLGCTVCAQILEITDPAEAAKDPDFKIQGEYIGEGIWPDGEKVKAGAQVVALGEGKFAVKVTKGGLPGEGWRRGDLWFSLSAHRQGEAVVLDGKDVADQPVTGKIENEVMTISSTSGGTALALKRTVRHSPTEGEKPPAGAIVLFDGTNADEFHNGRLTPDGNLWSNVTTKREFCDVKMHVEFRLSYMPLARGQARSNSGVYFNDCYEVQVLDSFGLEGEDNECGGLYSLRKPEVNMCFPPLTWQTYDIEFIAPRYRDGKKVSNARITVRHNGVLIHLEQELPRATPGRQTEGPPPRPIHLQGHGNKVQYRNIWIVEKKEGS